MIVRSGDNRKRRESSFSKKIIALKLILSAAAVICVVNLWFFQSYYSEKDNILNYNDDDDVRPGDGGWREEGTRVREEWEPISSVHNVDASIQDDISTIYDSNKDLATIDSLTSCFKARNDTVPHHLYGKLQKPYLNLGFPKTGTSSLHKFFQCGDLKSRHYVCKKGDSCARCMIESVEAGGRPLDRCDPMKIDAITQMDNGTWFPQIELLDELVAGYPSATIFLTFRSMENWYNSMQKWPPRPRGPHMNDKLRKENITGFPSGVGKNIDEFSDWFCKHVERVRDIAARNPSLTLVEVDIEDPSIATRMSDIFDIDESCWGRANVNPAANPDLNLTGVQLSKYAQLSTKE